MNEGNLKPWRKGESGNPGGVSKARIGYRQALEDAVSTENFTAVVKVLIQKAKDGNPWAVKEFFDLTLGKGFTLSLADDSSQSVYEYILEVSSRSKANGAKTVDVLALLEDVDIPEEHKQKIRDKVNAEQFPGRGFGAGTGD